MSRKYYSFTLVFDGPEELPESAFDRLYGGKCADATLARKSGAWLADFDRKADSLSEAIISAITDVEDAEVGLKVVRVEPDDLVTTSEAAERIGLSRETVRLYAKGARGQGDFPAPVANLRQRSPLYRWYEIASWVARTRTGKAPEDAPDARDLAFINAALELRRLAGHVSEAPADWWQSLVSRASTPHKASNATRRTKAARSKGKSPVGSSS